MLWLYGEGDVYYALQAAARYFGAFRSAGGMGRFVELQGGHSLFSWIDEWQDPVAAYVNSVAKSSQ